MDSKKISFGFSKSTKKSNLFIGKQEQQAKGGVELIECLEGQSIKLKNAKAEPKGPLVIPMNEPSNKIIERIKESRAKRTEVKQEIDERPDSELTLDELAARELLREAKSSEIAKTVSKVSELIAAKDEVILEGKPESTLEDYESVPISDYGMAMLRGMGWKEGMVIGKNQNTKVQMTEPTLRPKGLGLGANKMANVEKNTSKNNDEKELALVKGAYAKIIAGHNKGLYCQIEGFDDEAGRIIVKLAVKGLVLSLNEFLLVLVTKQEYDKSSKVINNAKFEEFKNAETSSSRDRRRNEQNGSDDGGRIKEEIKEEPEDDDKKSRHSKKDKLHQSRRHRSRSSSADRNYRKHKKSSTKKHKKSNRDSSEDDKKESRRNRSRSRSYERRKHKSKSKR